jgi:DNA-binding YbaB/EbfC family protein
MLDALKVAGALAGLMKNKEAIRAAAERIKARLVEIRSTGTAGGGAVTVTVSGQLRVLSVELSPALAGHVADEASRAMAQQLIAEATNAALGTAQAKAQEVIAKEAKELGLPDIPGLQGLLGA